MDKRHSNYIETKDLVEKGITSPSIILKEIPSIKQWSTAKKYITHAMEELSDESTKHSEEYALTISLLKELRSNALLRAIKSKHDNQQIGHTRVALQCTEQLVRLMALEGWSKEKNHTISTFAELVTQCSLKN